MAIFKAGILAFALSLSTPLVSGLSQSHPYASVQTTDGTAVTAVIKGLSRGTVIYKTETGSPEFMTKKSLPAQLDLLEPKPYPAVSNQTIATL